MADRDAAITLLGRWIVEDTMTDILSDNIEYPQTAVCACPRVEETVTTNYADILADFDSPCLVRSLVERCQALVTRCREMERQLSPRFTHTLGIRLVEVLEERDRARYALRRIIARRDEWQEQAEFARREVKETERQRDVARDLLQIRIDAGCTDESHLLLIQERDRLKRIIAGIQDWLDNYSDVEDRDGEDARPVPNWAMCGLQELERLEADRG